MNETIRQERSSAAITSVVNAMMPKVTGRASSKHNSLTIDPLLKDRKIKTEREIVKMELATSLDRDAALILTGKVWGCRASDRFNPDSIALILVSYKNEMIMIPADEFFTIEGDRKLKEAGAIKNYTLSEMDSLLSSRNNSEVDFIVTNITYDSEGRIEYVTGSRKKAMERRREKFWFAKKDHRSHDLSSYTIDEGTEIPDARIVCTTELGIIVEVFGVEQWLPKAELTYNNKDNIRKKFPSGGTVPIRILSVTRSKRTIVRKEMINGELKEKELAADDTRGPISFTASHKVLTDDAKKRIFTNLQEGDKVLGRGVVKGVKVGYFGENGKKVKIYVNVDGTYDILCFLDSFIAKLPEVGQRVDFKVKGKNEETGQVWGYIFHVYDEDSLLF